jgi:gamma-glutamyl-gamma-aminobutyrate hydrolase PuuD
MLKHWLILPSPILLIPIIQNRKPRRFQKFVQQSALIHEEKNRHKFYKTNFKNYWDWFTPRDLEDDIELIELNFEKNNSEDIYQCDGFVLTGGVDTHPSFYNGNTVYNNSPSSFQIERDYFEEKIYRYSQLNKLPVLGICRGMQLNQCAGGRQIDPGS